MRKVMMLNMILLILVVIPFLGCDNTKEQKKAKYSDVYVKSDNTQDHLSVKTMEGEKSTIEVDDHTLVIAIGTWCPHSKNFIKTIIDPRVSPSFQEYKWVFVVDEDEWPVIRKQLAELKGSEALHGLSVDAALERMKARAGNGPLVDPSVLDLLPGKVFAIPENSPIKLQSFPALYSRQSGEFDSHPLTMVAEKCVAALDIYRKLEKETEQ